MKITFADNQVSDIRFYTNPDGDFVPPHELKEENKKLEGFAWRINERPTKQEILLSPTELEKFMEEKAIKEEEIQEEEGTRLEKLMDEKIDLDKIRKTLKSPSNSTKQP
jgi:hypothetical protein